MPVDWNQHVKKASKALCGITLVNFDEDGNVYQGVIAETCGYVTNGGKKDYLFREPPGTIVLWSYRGGMITNIAAHEYEGSGLVEIRKVIQGDYELGPLNFTLAFRLTGKHGQRIRKTKGSGIYLVETPGLSEQGWHTDDVLNKEDHPEHRVAHWKLIKSE